MDKESACNTGDIGDVRLIPGSGRFPAVGNGNSLQYSRLKNPINREAWQATDQGVAKSQTQLSTECSIQFSQNIKQNILRTF